MHHRIQTLAVIVFVATTSALPAYAQDMREIEKLHQLDIAATLSGDQVALSTGWTDDIVILGQGEEPGVGRKTILEARERRSAALPGFRVVTYAPEIKDVTITDGWAFEWGTYSGTLKPLDGGEPIRTTGKVIRVLKKDSDGSWKIARAMYDSEDEGGGLA